MSQKSTSVQTIKIDELIPDPQNARLHPEENKEAIEASLKRFGAARSIVVDSEGVVRAGSGTLEAAKKLGYKTIKIVETDGKELVAVFRPDWTEQEAVGYGIADNRTAEFAEWDKENLEEIVSGLKDVDLKDLGFSEADLNSLCAEADLADMSGFERDISNVEGVVSSIPKKNENWFYVEFYEDDERYNRLNGILKEKKVSKHEIDKDFFEKMILDFGNNE